MNGGEVFNATKVRKFMESGVLEKTALFIEPFDGQMHGNALAVLQGILNDARFTDWKIYWTVLHADGVEDDLTGAQKDPRMELVSAGSVRFMEALETSQLVMTCSYLPAYYSKNKRQVVIGLFPDHYFESAGTINRQRALLHQSLGKIDFLFVEGAAARNALKAWYPAGTPFEVIEGAPLRHVLQQRFAADVILSLSDKAMGKLYADMEQRFRSIELICVERDMTLSMRIRHARRVAYRYENAPEVLDRVSDDVFPICQSLQGARALVTDQLNDVRESIIAGVPCVFFTNMLGEYYELYRENKGLLSFAGDWDEVCAGLKSVLDSDIKAASFDQTQREATKALADLIDSAFLACDEIWKAVEVEKFTIGQLEQLLSGGVTTVRDPHMRGMACNAIRNTLLPYFSDVNDGQTEAESTRGSRSTLFVLLSAQNPMIMRALTYYKPSENVSVLFTSASTPEMWGKSLDKRICLHVKQGKYHSDLATFQSEWRRMVGNRTYDTIYAKTTTDSLWNQMYECAPGKQVVSITQNQIFKLLFESVGNPVLRHYDWETEPIDMVDLDGAKYYMLGEDNSETLYLQCRKPIERPILAFVNEPGDRARLEELLDLYRARSCFLLDPDRHMKGSPLLKRANVYWLPMKKLPVKLFLYAQTLMCCRDQALVFMAEYLQKKVVHVDDVKLQPTVCERWKLLEIRSVNDILA